MTDPIEITIKISRDKVEELIHSFYYNKIDLSGITEATPIQEIIEVDTTLINAIKSDKGKIEEVDKIMKMLFDFISTPATRDKIESVDIWEIIHADFNSFQKSVLYKELSIETYFLKYVIPLIVSNNSIEAHLSLYTYHLLKMNLEKSKDTKAVRFKNWLNEFSEDVRPKGKPEIFTRENIIHCIIKIDALGDWFIGSLENLQNIKSLMSPGDQNPVPYLEKKKKVYWSYENTLAEIIFDDQQVSQTLYTGCEIKDNRLIVNSSTVIYKYNLPLGFIHFKDIMGKIMSINLKDFTHLVIPFVSEILPANTNFNELYSDEDEQEEFDILSPIFPVSLMKDLMEFEDKYHPDRDIIKLHILYNCVYRNYPGISDGITCAITGFIAALLDIANTNTEEQYLVRKKKNNLKDNYRDYLKDRIYKLMNRKFLLE